MEYMGTQYFNLKNLVIKAERRLLKVSSWHYSGHDKCVCVCGGGGQSQLKIQWNAIPCKN